MKFDVVRASDYEQGREGANAPCPIHGAAFNKEENRWELEVPTLEELMKLLDEKADGTMVLHGMGENGLGLLEIYDLRDEGCGRPDCINCNPPLSGPHALS